MSSQYLTALLMAAPLATGSEGVHIRIKDELVSQPYVDMTVRLMERFGVTVRACSSLSCCRSSTNWHEGVPSAACCAVCAPLVLQHWIAGWNCAPRHEGSDVLPEMLSI